MNNEVRTLIVLPSLDSGGAERLYVDLAALLPDYGIRADLCIIESEGMLLEEARGRGIRLIDARPRLGWMRINRLTPQREVVVRLAWAFRRYDVVVGGLAFMPTVYCAQAKRLTPRPLIATSHSQPTQAVEQFGYGPQMEQIFAAYRRVDCLVGVSPEVTRDSAALFNVEEARATVIPSGIDFERVDRLAAQEPELALDDKVPTVVAVGMLRPEKDHQLLLRAHRQVLDKGLRHRLLIVGEGSERPRLEKLIAELEVEYTVSLPGRLANPFAVLIRSHLFCHPSLNEGQGLAPLEALSLGVPIVATSSSETLVDVLERYHAGHLVESGDLEGLAMAITSHLLDPGKLRARAVEAAPEIRHHYSIEACAAAYAAEIRRLAAR